MAGLHVAEVIAYVPAVFRRDIQALCAFNQWVWMGFGMRRGVSGNQTACFTETDLSNQRSCEAFNLVGDGLRDAFDPKMKR